MLGAILPESLKQIFKKAATNLYPAEPFPVPKDFRGKLVADIDKCIGCKFCSRDCSAQAIEITDVTPKMAEGSTEKPKRKSKITVYLDRCVYCGQCVEVCPTKTLSQTDDHELAAYDRKEHKIEWSQ